MTRETTALPESSLHTFIDEAREFALYFLEGQRLIHDLAVIHSIRGKGFAYFRDVVLSIQPMIALLKGGEQFGFYIDSEEPYFRLKIEAAHHGATRCALLPEDFRHFPEAMHGLVRVQKLFPGNRPPYQSVLEAEGLALREIVNRVLTDSYQTNCAVLVSQRSDQSGMLHQLPPLKGEYVVSPEVLRVRREGIESDLREIFARALTDPGQIRNAIQGIGFRFLAARPVIFRCSCSKGRVLQSLARLGERDRADLFHPGEETVEITCEYCKKRYEISRADLAAAASPIN